MPVGEEQLGRDDQVDPSQVDEGEFPGSPVPEADASDANAAEATVTEKPSQGGRSRSRVPLWVILALAGLFGGVVGLGLFTIDYASGASYLSNDPEACANCHIMWDQFDGWNRGPHHTVATCNDCHAPHDSLIRKYVVKAINGVRHSYAFTTGDFPEPIRITPMNEDIAREACLYCHGSLTNDINHADTAGPTDCLRCHRGVGHG